MRYVSAKYEQQLDDLAGNLMESFRQRQVDAAQPTGQVALATVIELPVLQPLADSQPSIA